MDDVKDTENPPDISRKVNRGVSWVGLASGIVAILDVVAMILIMRFWVSGVELGIVTPAIALFAVLDYAAELGLSSAIVQADEITEDKVSTIFWLSLMISCVIFLLLVFVLGPVMDAVYGPSPVMAAFVAPLLGEGDAPLFFTPGILSSFLAAYGLKLIWQNTYYIPWTLLTRSMRYKEISTVRMLSNLAEFTGKVGSAAAGYGVWCFVIGPLCRVVVATIGMQYYARWLPKFTFKPRETLEWAKFGFTQSAHKMLFYLYANVDYLIVGYFFSAAATGFYRIAYEIVLEPARVISEVVTGVAFNTFARLKYARDRFVEQFISFTRMNLILSFAFLGIVFVPTESLLTVLYGDAYLPAAPITRVLCAVGVLRAMSFMVPPVLDGVGKPKLSLLYQAVAAITLPLVFLGCAYALGDTYEELSVGIGWAVGYPIAFVVLFAMGLRILGLHPVTYLRRIYRIPVFAGIAMLASWGGYEMASSASSAVRLLVAVAIMVVVFAGLLAKFEGITLRSIRASM